MGVTDFPGPNIKKFEVTVVPLALGIRAPNQVKASRDVVCAPIEDLSTPIVMTVSREWIAGKKPGDMVDAVTTDNQIMRGEITCIRPVREGF